MLGYTSESQYTFEILISLETEYQITSKADVLTGQSVDYEAHMVSMSWILVSPDKKLSHNKRTSIQMYGSLIVHGNVLIRYNPYFYIVLGELV